MHYTLIAVILILCQAGCTSLSQNASQKDILPERMSIPTVKTAKAQPAEGSLYNDRAMNLYQDNRAHQIGDILVVNIVETSSGKKNAKTKTERESTVSGDLTYLFRFASWMHLQDPNIPGSQTIGANLTNDFEGKGETSRNSTVTATISARVIDKTMDGNLIIRGFREIKVNNETQHIILSGMVRPQDISPDNSIKSSHIADARIEYGGVGVLAEKQNPGWLARTLDVVWPF
ncbi:MAG: flagellar basal body L-ring protein FlgH [Desulfobulbaceae bacterium]|uniref:Flagellar L-ring protein n=1 Tax=Candidatus Desulfobia pelagia TaxID=2841692 RepID=A0A8J6NFG4_9BACT|nr:flagellar basal body L-ring protein FlgH [Candidatus Desulfobia pelagia]